MARCVRRPWTTCRDELTDALSAQFKTCGRLRTSVATGRQFSEYMVSSCRVSPSKVLAGFPETVELRQKCAKKRETSRSVTPTSDPAANQLESRVDPSAQSDVE